MIPDDMKPKQLFINFLDGRQVLFPEPPSLSDEIQYDLEDSERVIHFENHSMSFELGEDVCRQMNRFFINLSCNNWRKRNGFPLIRRKGKRK